MHRGKHTIPTHIAMHAHKHCELVYFISGKGSTLLKSREYEYKSHTFAFYEMGAMHDEKDPEPCDIIWFHFDYNIPGFSLKEGLFEDRDGRLLSSLMKLRSEYIKEKNGQSPVIESLLSYSIITAGMLQKNDGQKVRHPDWQEVIGYIDENIMTDIDFYAVAKKYHYSYDRFRHLFKARFGVSPKSYLMSARIERAKILIEGSSYSFTDIAFDCGFGTSSQFTNIFKKHTGVTPKEYRLGHGKLKEISQPVSK